MKEGFQLREVFNEKEVVKLAKAIKKKWPEFNEKKFIKSINSRINDLNFGARSSLIADSLKKFLPEDFPKAAKILINSLGPELGKPELSGFEGFIVMPQTLFIARNGLNHFDISMNAFYEMTKRFSAEGDIRPFITKYPQKTLKLLEKWTKDPNCHVRRLVSEGTRPRLPLMPRLLEFQKDPAPALKLLENLKTDPELYVRRSVANNLNDIAKDNPELVVKTLKEWKKVKNSGAQWIIKHASRSLVKSGNKEALELLGYPPKPQIKVNKLNIDSETIEAGANLNFSFIVKSSGKKSQNLMVDYIIFYMKSNGKQAPKVFKLAKKKIGSGEMLEFSKKHSFKAMTTRKHYPGEHFLSLMINGKVFQKKRFIVKE